MPEEKPEDGPKLVPIVFYPRFTSVVGSTDFGSALYDVSGFKPLPPGSISFQVRDE